MLQLDNSIGYYSVRTLREYFGNKIICLSISTEGMIQNIFFSKQPRNNRFLILDTALPVELPPCEIVRIKKISELISNSRTRQKI